MEGLYKVPYIYQHVLKFNTLSNTDFIRSSNNPRKVSGQTDEEVDSLTHQVTSLKAHC